jgi:hypothetical protein
MITERMREFAGISESDVIKLKGFEQQDNRDNLQAFMKEYTSKTQQHPLMHTDRIYKGVMSIELLPFDGRIHISSILVIGEKEAGSATMTMKWLASLADKHDVDMDLEPEPFGPTTITKSKLASFYKRFGFVNAKYGQMIRTAK